MLQVKTSVKQRGPNKPQRPRAFGSPKPLLAATRQRSAPAALGPGETADVLFVVSNRSGVALGWVAIMAVSIGLYSRLQRRADRGLRS